MSTQMPLWLLLADEVSGGYTFVGSGGVIVGGEADTEFPVIWEFVGDGGIILGGEAVVVTGVPTSVVVTGSGGVEIGGDASVETGTALVTLDWQPGEHLLRAMTPDGPIWVSVCGRLEWGRARPFTVNEGVMGGRQVVSGQPGGRDFSLVLAVRSDEEAALVDRILTSSLVYVSPADSPAAWAVPTDSGINIIKVGRIRELTVSMVGTGPEPAPEVGDF